MYPYGSNRINQQFGATFNEQKQFIGQYVDPETNLSYLQARYYDGSKGEFLSEDPVFLAIGNPQKVKQLSQQDQWEVLAATSTLFVVTTPDGLRTQSDFASPTLVQ